MNSEKFNEELLKLKKQKFLEVVLRICKFRNLPKPVVNFDGCSDEDEEQLAHMHPELDRICISENQLIKQNMDDIENTAAHEMTHLLEQNHDSGFHSENLTNNIASWRPPGGTVIGYGKTKRPKKQRKKDKSRCNYHLCRKKTKLKLCQYCDFYLCKEHTKPKEPVMINLTSSDMSWKTRKTDSEKSGHPCSGYERFFRKEDIKQKEEQKQRIYAIFAKTKKLSEEEPMGENDNRCTYHLCQKPTKLIMCSYCKNSYCKNHKKARTPIPVGEHFKDDETENYLASHPCSSYTLKSRKKTENPVSNHNDEFIPNDNFHIPSPSILIEILVILILIISFFIIFENITLG
jgi:predicted nucleic acid binding AN1-type Zn finger protein